MKSRFKRLLALLLVTATAVSVVPDVGMDMLVQAAQVQEEQVDVAADTKAAEATTEEEISSETYKELGMEINEEEYSTEIGDEPFAEATAMNVQNELYTTTRGTKGNAYQVRDFKNIYGIAEAMTDFNLNAACMGGNYEKYAILGAFDYYGVNPSVNYRIGGKATKLGAIGDQGTLCNDKVYNRNYKLYSMNAAFDAGEGKDNYLAEVTVNDLVDNQAKVYLDIWKVGDNGQRKWLASKQLGSISGDFLKKYKSLQEFDAVIEITAGDFGNLGYDYLAVYCGDNVEILDFSKVDNTLTQKGNIDIALPSPRGAGTTTDYRSMPVVTLSAGDLKRDNTDELVVNVTMPYGSENYATAAKTYLYDYKNSKFVQDQAIALTEEEEATHAMMGANSAIGTIGGEPVLFIGGYNAWHKESNGFGEVMYKTVTYDTDAKKFMVADTVVMENTKKDIVDSVKTKYEDYHWIYEAPVSMATAKTKGRDYDSQLFFNGILWSYDATENSISQITEMLYSPYINDVYNNEISPNPDYTYNGIGNYWIGNVVTGNFTGDEDGKEQIMAVFGKSDGDVENFAFDINIIWKRSSGDNNEGYDCTGESAVSLMKRTNTNAGNPILALAAIDVDSDSTLIRYDSQNIVYSNPVVYSVLQAAPYFADLADLFPDSYPTNASTEYASYKGSETGANVGVSASLGVYTSVEGGLFAGGQMETEVTTSLSADVSTSMSKTTQMSYNVNAASLDNKVVAYVQPYVIYSYDIYDTTTKTWKDKGMVVQVPLKASKSFLDVSEYNEIASRTKGLDPITEFSNTIGDPSTYKSVPSGFKAVGDLLTSNTSQGGTTTASLDISQATSMSVETEVSINTKVGGGATFLGNSAMAGVTASASASFGVSHTSTTGMIYSGAVDTLPSAATGYNFSAQFGYANVKLNGNRIPYLCYKVINYADKPAVPKNFQVTDVTCNSVTLAWDAMAGAESYVIYKVNEQGKVLAQEEIPATGECSYTDNNKDYSTTYRYRIAQKTTMRGESLPSNIVSVTTLSEAAKSFKITKMPESQSAYIGGEITLSTAATAQNSAGEDVDIKYKWQYRENEAAKWKDSTIGTGVNTDTLKLIMSKEYEGYQFRCEVFCNTFTHYLYTTTATVNCNNIEQDADGVYQIDSEATLRSFASIVNGTTENAVTNAKGKLTADIQLTQRWIPIGCTEHAAYSGTFDGAGHSISGLSGRYGTGDTYNAVGLFGNIAAQGKVSNLTVSGTIQANRPTGIIAGNNAGTIEYCNVVDSNTIADDVEGLAGIAGINAGTINNCSITDSTITRLVNGAKTQNAGGITETNTGTISNCLVSNVQLSNGQMKGEICAVNTASVTNTYYDQVEQKKGNVDGIGTLVTAEDMQSGKVAWQLDCQAGEDKTHKNIWGQNLVENETVPVLHGATVYKVTLADQEQKELYSNSEFVLPDNTVDEGKIYQYAYEEIATGGNGTLVQGDKITLNKDVVLYSTVASSVTITFTGDYEGTIIPKVDGTIELPTPSAGYEYIFTIDGEKVEEDAVYTTDTEIQVMKKDIDASLSELTYTMGNNTFAVPEFAADTTEYTVELGCNTVRDKLAIQVKGIKRNNGNAITKDITLTNGKASAELVVAADDGVAKTYKIDFTVKEHEYEEKVITHATAQTKGKIRYTCTVCGHTYDGQIESEVIAAPAASIAAGDYTASQTVTLSTDKEKCIIYYTLDGSEPTSESDVYTQAITIGEGTTTVKTMAVYDDKVESATAVYTYNVASSKLAAPTASLASGEYRGQQEVELTCDNADAYIYYTLDGTDPTTDSEAYLSAIQVNADTTIKAIAVTADEESSDIVQFTYSIIADDKAKAPVASVTAGTYTGRQLITFTGVDEGAEIYYTLDGTDPTEESDVYEEPILMEEGNTKLRAMAVAEGYDNSNIVTYEYQINLAAPQASVEPGIHETHQPVDLSCENEDAYIYYTLDGSDPITEGDLYDGTIQLERGETNIIKTVAVLSRVAADGTDELLYSDVVTYRYFMVAESAAAPTASLKAGTYTGVQTVKLSSATPNADIYYTLDGSEPTEDSDVYEGENITLDKGTTVVRAYAVCDGYADSTKMTYRYTINYAAAATPVISRAGGTYTAAQKVTLSCTTPGAVIYYTLDGTVPTEDSDEYDGTIDIPVGTTTLQAIAYAEGYEKSEIAIAKYEIQIPTLQNAKLATAKTTSLKFTWTKTSGMKYKLQLYKGKKRVAQKTTANGSYTFTKLSTGTDYTLKITAGGKTVSIKAATLPNKAKLSSVKKSGSNKAKVTWKKVTGATGYEVYMKTGNGKYKLVKNVTKNKTVSYTKSKLKKGTSYSFKVRAYKKVGSKKYYGSYSSVKKLKMK